MKGKVAYMIVYSDTIQEKLEGLSGSEIRLLLMMCTDSEFPEGGRRKDKTAANLVYVADYREQWRLDLKIKTMGGMSNLIKALEQNDCIRRYAFGKYLINPNIVFKGKEGQKKEAIEAYDKLTNEKVNKDKAWAALLQ